MLLKSLNNKNITNEYCSTSVASSSSPHIHCDNNMIAPLELEIVQRDNVHEHKEFHGDEH